MAKNKILVGLIVLILVGSLSAMFLGSTPSVSPQAYNNSPAPEAAVSGNTQPGISVATSAPATGNTSGATAGLKTFTLADISAHNSEASCYTAINGSVYDVTSYINQHPGGSQAVLATCGKDGSVSYNNQHGGQRKPANELAKFKIGALAS